jgi:hypothetical protein
MTLHESFEAAEPFLETREEFRDAPVRETVMSFIRWLYTEGYVIESVLVGRDELERIHRHEQHE